MLNTNYLLYCQPEVMQVMHRRTCLYFGNTSLFHILQASFCHFSFLIWFKFKVKFFRIHQNEVILMNTIVELHCFLALWLILNHSVLLAWDLSANVSCSTGTETSTHFGAGQSCHLSQVFHVESRRSFPEPGGIMHRHTSGCREHTNQFSSVFRE